MSRNGNYAPADAGRSVDIDVEVGREKEEDGLGLDCVINMTIYRGMQLPLRYRPASGQQQ